MALQKIMGYSAHTYNNWVLLTRTFNEFYGSNFTLR